MKSANEKIFTGSPDQLRTPERIQSLDISDVLEHCLNHGDIHSVLDVGTGSGLFAEAFAKRGLEVRGIDSNPDMVQEAQKRVPLAYFKQGRIESIPYANATFDLVFCGHAGGIRHGDRRLLRLLLRGFDQSRSQHDRFGLMGNIFKIRIDGHSSFYLYGTGGILLRGQ